MKDQCRLDIINYALSHRTINEWNKLSTDCVNASSVNMVKNKIGKYLMGGLHIDEKLLDS